MTALDIQETIFNTSVGKVTYELPYSGSSETGFYLKGDSRTITNQSGSSTSQLCIVNGAEHPEIQLRYRPTVTYVTAGLENGKAVNNIRIYIVNLNSSSVIAQQGDLPLQIILHKYTIDLQKLRSFVSESRKLDYNFSFRRCKRKCFSSNFKHT